MINKELIYVIQQIGNEKGIGVEVLFEALESALLSASKKTMGVADNVRMHLDRHTGALQVFARKKVVEAVTRSQARDPARRGPRAERATPSWTTRSRWSWRPRSSGASPRRPPSR